MSSLDSGLTGLAGNVTQNIYPAACRALNVVPWEGGARLVFGKVINLACAVLIVSSAMAMARLGQGGIFKILLDVMGTIIPPIAVPMVLSLFLRRVPPVVPFVSIGAGLGVSLSIFLAPLVMGASPWTFQAQVATVAAVSLGAFFLVRARCRMDEATLVREQEFFSRRDRPVDFAAEIGVGNDGRQLRIVGVFATVLGAALFLLLIPTSSVGHAGKIVAVAFATVALGSLMIWLGRRVDRTGVQAR
jgi:hypothetical protein